MGSPPCGIEVDSSVCCWKLWININQQWNWKDSELLSEPVPTSPTCSLSLYGLKVTSHPHQVSANPGHRPRCPADLQFSLHCDNHPSCSLTWRLPSAKLVYCNSLLTGPLESIQHVILLVIQPTLSYPKQLTVYLWQEQPTQSNLRLSALLKGKSLMEDPSSSPLHESQHQPSDY